MIILCTVIPFSVFSQTDAPGASAVITYAEGGKFDVIHNDKRTSYDIAAGDTAEGIELYSGDNVDTYGGTFLELQLVPSDNTVTVAENTSFVVEKTEKSGGGSFQLIYGRVRAKVAKLIGSERFKITGPSMVAGVRGTDFGVDSIFDKTSGGALLSRVYCFEGTVAVNKVPDTAGAGVSKTVLIHADEMVAVLEKKGKSAEKLQVEPLSTEVRIYWQKNDPAAGHDVQKGTPPAVPRCPRQAHAAKTGMLLKKESFRRAAVWTGTAGILLEAAGALLFYSSDIAPSIIRFDNKSMAQPFFISGGVMLGGSLLSLLGYVVTRP